MDDSIVTTKKHKNKNDSGSQDMRSKFKRGLKIGCINACGLVSNPDKRVALNHWIELNDLDIICIQEWFVPHGKQTESEFKSNMISNNNNNNNSDEYNSDNIDSDNSSVFEFDRFEDEKKNDAKYLHISLDMTAFPRYHKIETNSKTVILYRIGLSIVDLGNIDPISLTGLDVTWIGVECNRNITIVGNVYHSPSYECEYDELLYQLNHVKNMTKKYNHSTIVMAGDFNAKHQIWGSTITDNRGIQLNEWLLFQRLTFINDGTYTHVSKDKKEVLDIMAI